VIRPKPQPKPQPKPPKPKPKPFPSESSTTARRTDNQFGIYQPSSEDDAYEPPVSTEGYSPSTWSADSAYSGSDTAATDFSPGDADIARTRQNPHHTFYTTEPPVAQQHEAIGQPPSSYPYTNQSVAPTNSQKTGLSSHSAQPSSPAQPLWSAAHGRYYRVTFDSTGAFRVSKRDAAADLTYFAVASRPRPVSLAIIRCDAALGCERLLVMPLCTSTWSSVCCLRCLVMRAVRFECNLFSNWKLLFLFSVAFGEAVTYIQEFYISEFTALAVQVATGYRTNYIALYHS